MAKENNFAIVLIFCFCIISAIKILTKIAQGNTMNFTTKTKKITLALALVLALSSAHADSSYMTYQGVAFDNGTAKASTNISLRFTIYATDGTTVVYQETKSSVATTDKGFFSHQIGSGTRTAGAASYAVVTMADDYKLKVEVDYANGTAYTDLGTNDLTSSFYAKKLDGVTATAAELNKLSGVTASTTELNKLAGVTATAAQLDYVAGATSNIQTQLGTKQATITGSATTIDTETLTASRALASDASGKVAVSAVTSTELGYLTGVTSAIQTQLGTKQATITGSATSIDTETLTASRALGTDGNGKVSITGTTTTQLSYLNAVTSDIQTQLDAKKIYYTSGTGTGGITGGTNYPMFPAGNDTITLAVGTYRYNIAFVIRTSSAPATSAYVSFAIGGSGGISGSYNISGVGAIVYNGATTPVNSSDYNLAGVVLVCPSSSATGNREYNALLQGIIRVETAGTITPSYKFSATLTGATVNMYASNYMTIEKIADTSVTTFGGWN